MSNIYSNEARLTPADEALVKAYSELGVPADALPYTDAFKQLRETLGSHFASDEALLRRIFNLRKAGRLPRLGRGTPPAPKVDPAVAELLMDIVTEQLKSIGMRDRLPYTRQFELVKQKFLQRTGVDMDDDQLWRLISNLAK